MAQNLQIGFGVAVNNTFFHKGNSVYKDEYHGTGLFPGGGAFTAVSLQMSDAWSLRSGIGFHIKQYRVLIGNMGVEGVEGHFSMDVRFNCLELPVVLAYQTAEKKVFKYEYRLGLVSSYYMPVQQGSGFSLEGSVPAEMGISSPEPTWEKTYSPDIFLSVALLKNHQNTRRHEFAISYQYGLLPTAPFEYNAYVRTSKANINIDAVLRPTLSSFMLSYTFYPRWLNFGGVTEE